jgi:2-polyprenyl-6-hydroxyphenyl methylase / 3-demethylubiquinone-9 3-methyltransferase
MIDKADNDNIDRAEVDKFNAMADMWWDRRGQFKALHDINPVRLGYVCDRTVLDGRKVLDVGCGGGLLCEVLARAGAHVTGIDMSAEALSVARLHAQQHQLSIDYRHSSAEQFADGNAEAFDIVTCMELVEHVPDPDSLIRACSRLVKTDGDVIFATVNRTWLARLLVIWASEYLLGIVRKGTHRYDRFVQPEELYKRGRHAGLIMVDVSGLRYIPFIGRTTLSTDVRMNYLMHFTKIANPE